MSACKKCKERTRAPTHAELAKAVQRASEHLAPYPDWDGASDYEAQHRARQFHDQRARISARVTLSPLLHRLAGLCEQCAEDASRAEAP